MAQSELLAILIKVHKKSCGKFPVVSVEGPLPASSRNRFSHMPRRPAREVVVERRCRPIGFGTVRPAAAASEDMHNRADDAAIIHALLASNPSSANAVRCTATAHR